MPVQLPIADRGESKLRFNDSAQAFYLGTDTGFVAIPGALRAGQFPITATPAPGKTPGAGCVTEHRPTTPTRPPQWTSGFFTLSCKLPGAPLLHHNKYLINQYISAYGTVIALIIIRVVLIVSLLRTA